VVSWLSSAVPNAVASTQPSQGQGISQALYSTILNLDNQMDQYEDPYLLNTALDCIPIQDLYERAEKVQNGDNSLPSLEDALADATVNWFKKEFFRWADPIKCPTCSGETKMAGMAPPTPEELRGRAGRVELHECLDSRCGAVFRFPRYGDLSKLLQFRMGRCGEFASTFTLILRAIGLRARYVWNLEDHVWNEYYSTALERWVHLDSCEAARDQPLLYDTGWGKKMSYIFAFSTDGAQDVTRGYVADWEATLARRNKGSEEVLAQCFAQIIRRRRFGLAPDTLQRLEKEDAAERSWLMRGHRHDEDAHGQGRQSGTAGWKEARGEAGK
jgi:peptide-N4-(N-acetyl-beta-glucosaminyl)asparagine amidase